MSKIFISMSGEGRGHASRVAALVPALQREHDVMLFTPGDAYELLEPVARRHQVPLVRIEGLMNRYAPDGRWDHAATLSAALSFCRRVPDYVRRVADIVRAERPDLVVTDFEPILPRAAERCGVPYVSVNHQHYLRVSDLGYLPEGLRRQAQLAGFALPAMYHRQRRTVVSSFFHTRLKPAFEQRADVELIGPLLRPHVLAMEASPSAHGALVYVRKHAPAAFLEGLLATGMPTVVYGLGRRPAHRNLTFKEVHEEEFLHDLAGCRLLICTAGNQIIGEAMYFGKPVLALPEPNNFEQAINAHFVCAMGIGQAVPLAHCTANNIAGFVRAAECYPRHLDRSRLDGMGRVLRILRDELGYPSTLERGARPGGPGRSSGSDARAA